MNIAALSTISGLTQTPAGNMLTKASQPDGTSMFSDIFNGLISDANQSDAAFQADIVKASEGELDDPQQLMIDSSKASISLQMVTSLRNDALEAYNDIIKMQV